MRETPSAYYTELVKACKARSPIVCHDSKCKNGWRTFNGRSTCPNRNYKLSADPFEKQFWWCDKECALCHGSQMAPMLPSLMQIGDMVMTSDQSIYEVNGIIETLSGGGPNSYPSNDIILICFDQELGTIELLASDVSRVVGGNENEFHRDPRLQYIDPLPSKRSGDLSKMKHISS
jgi:hypothetical protein